MGQCVAFDMGPQGTVASLSSLGQLPPGKLAAILGTNSLRPGPHGEKLWLSANSQEKLRSF